MQDTSEGQMFRGLYVTIYKELRKRSTQDNSGRTTWVNYKYSVPFLHFYNWLSTLSATVYIFKQLTVFAFLQTKSLCILMEETQKGKKAVSRWNSGERVGKCWQELPLCLPTANASFYSSRELCEPMPPLAVAQSLALSREKEKTCETGSFILVWMPHPSVWLLVEIICCLIIFMPTESDLKAVTLEKWIYACRGGRGCEWRRPVWFCSHTGSG